MCFYELSTLEEERTAAFIKNKKQKNTYCQNQKTFDTFVQNPGLQIRLQFFVFLNCFFLMHWKKL